MKFIHLIFALSLFALSICGLMLVSSKKFVRSNFNGITLLNKCMLVLALLATLTGTFLVYPKHFTFHTPWIQAAYLFVMMLSLGILFLIYFKKKLKWRWVWWMAYFIFIIILLSVIHDAVTKTTFLI